MSEHRSTSAGARSSTLPPTPPPTGRWRDVARASGLLRADGAVASTIFAEMSALAASTGAINLGQGAPDVDGPGWVRRAAADAIAPDAAVGANQYPPGGGTPALRAAIAEHQRRHYGIELDPATQVHVTTGATEAIATTILALAGLGDDVVTLEPYYDSYAASIALAGARHVGVPLVRAPGAIGDVEPTVGEAPSDAGDRFALDVAALREAVTARTRIILVNTPHNPTGTVLTPAELDAIASVAREHDAIVVTDEVYEHLTFDGVRHVPIASLPGMFERTLTISSSGKSWSLTGWKIGWVSGPAELVTAVRTVQQFVSYTSGAPFQPAIARALADDTYPRELAASLATRRDLLSDGLERAGFTITRPQGTYFVVADGAGLGFDDGVELGRRLPELAGVVAVPVSAFCTPGSRASDEFASSVRFTFVKQEAVLRDAVERLGRLGRPHPDSSHGGR